MSPSRNGLDLEVYNDCAANPKGDPSNSVQGIGDEAYWVAGDLLLARKNKTCLGVLITDSSAVESEQVLGEDKRREGAKTLAQAAIGRLKR